MLTSCKLVLQKSVQPTFSNFNLNSLAFLGQEEEEVPRGQEGEERQKGEETEEEGAEAQEQEGQEL